MVHGTPRNSARALSRISSARGRTRSRSRMYNSASAQRFSGGIARSTMGTITRTARLRQAVRKAVHRNRTSHVRGARQDVTLTSNHTGMAIKDIGVVTMGPPKAKVPNTIGNYKFQNRNQWVVAGVFGQQVADYFECLFTRTQLVGAVDNLRANRLSWPVSPFGLNPYVNRSNTTVFPNPITEVSRSDVLYIKNVNMKLDLLSMVTVPQEVMVYWMTPVFDTNINPIDSWITIMEAKNQGGVVQIPSALVMQLNSTGGNARNIDYGQNPFHNREFTKVWKAVKSSKVILQAGEQVNLRLKFHYEKVVSRSTIAEVRGGQFLAGLTIFPMVIVRSGLVGVLPEGTGSGTPAGEVTNAACKVGAVTNYQIEFGALGAARLSTNQAYMGTVEAGTEDKRIIDDDDDVVNVQYL